MIEDRAGILFRKEINVCDVHMVALPLAYGGSTNFDIPIPRRSDTGCRGSRRNMCGVNSAFSLQGLQRRE